MSALKKAKFIETEFERMAKDFGDSRSALVAAGGLGAYAVASLLERVNPTGVIAAAVPNSVGLFPYAKEAVVVGTLVTAGVLALQKAVRPGGVLNRTSTAPRCSK